MWIQVYGNKGKTQRILLTDVGFEVGDSVTKFLGDYVGTVFKVAF
jgi:hypothetical protein